MAKLYISITYMIKDISISYHDISRNDFHSLITMYHYVSLVAPSYARDHMIMKLLLVVLSRTREI